MMPSEYIFGEMEVRSKHSKKNDRNNFAVLIKTAGMEPRSLLSEFTGSIRKNGKRSLSIAIATNVPKVRNSLKSLYRKLYKKKYKNLYNRMYKSLFKKRHSKRKLYKKCLRVLYKKRRFPRRKWKLRCCLTLAKG